ncbi:MAG: TolC family protein [Odoribacter sp.]|nr:TolC family protein [Odoribacter sp.]
MRTIILVTFLLTFYTKISIAQVYELTLQQSIEIAKNQSSSILQLAEDTKIAEYNLKATISGYRTNINLGLTLPKYSETVRQWEDSTGISFYPVKHLSYSGNLTVSQPLPTDGWVYLETGLSSLSDYNTHLRAAHMNTRIGFSQPLHSFYGYNSLKASIKRAELDYERSSKSLKREELNLIYRVSNSYYNLLSLQKSTEIAVLDLERQMEAYDISKKKFESGLIKEVEALQMEVDLAEAQNNYEIALLNEMSATNSFKELIGVNLQDSIVLKN